MGFAFEGTLTQEPGGAVRILPYRVKKMPIDTTTLGTPNLKTTDGRAYPVYLRAFERYDREMLSSIRELGEPTLNQMAMAAPDAKLRSAVSPWIASAEWRLLIERVDSDEPIGKRRYRLSERGQETLAELS